MRNKTAKRLKKEVMIMGYLGDGVTMEDLKKGKKEIFANDEFKSMYRKRKKFYNNPPGPEVAPPAVPDEKLQAMRDVRLKNRAYQERHRKNK